MKILGIIPARYGSTRLPAKPLALINGKPMIWWVYYGAQSYSLSDLVVATDHEAIYNTVIEFGGQAIYTSPDCQTGTERILEVFQKKFDYDFYLNIQGDEPLVSEEHVNKLISAAQGKAGSFVTTLATKIINIEDITNPNTCKVVIGKNNKALYFSRSPIPYVRGAKPEELLNYNYYKHLGFYGYSNEFLNFYNLLQPTYLDDYESLEQDLWIYNSVPIYVEFTSKDTASVDVPDDLIKVERMLNENSR